MRFIDVGDQSPEFTLPAHDGSEVSSTDFSGKPVVLFYYPKANTSG